MVRDDSQPNSRGLYTPYTDSILIKGKMIILYVVTFDHGDTSGVILWTCYFSARSPQRSVVRQRTKRVMPKRLFWTSLGGTFGLGRYRKD